MIQQLNTNHSISFKQIESLYAASNEDIITMNANVANH